MNTYRVSWNAAPTTGTATTGTPGTPCTREFGADFQFHSAVAAILSEAGPVHFVDLTQDMLHASKAGAHVDPLQLVEVLANSIGVFGATGEAVGAAFHGDPPTPPHHLPPSMN